MTIGMSGKKFMLLSALALTAVFVVGSYALGAPGNVVTATITNLPRYVLEVLVKFTTWFTFTGLLAAVVFPVVLDTPLGKLWDWFAAPRNDSHAHVLIGLGGVVAIAMLGAQGVTLQQYAFTVMTKGSLGFFLGILAMVVGAWLIGVRSMDDLRGRLVEEDNSSHVDMVMAILNIAMAFAMLA